MFSRIETITVWGRMLASCTYASSVSDQHHDGSPTSGIALVDENNWGTLDPFYVCECSADVDTVFGHIQFRRIYGPHGKLSNVNAMWQTPMMSTVPPRIQLAFTPENGEDFDLANGIVLLDWEFIPALRPTTIRSRMSIGNLPFSPEPQKGTAAGMVSTMFRTNSVAMASVRWGDFTSAARAGVVNIRVDVTGAPVRWKDRLYKSYLTGLTAVGNDALMRQISTTTLTTVEAQLNRMAAQTDVHRPEDVPRRCYKTDQVPIND